MRLLLQHCKRSVVSTPSTWFCDVVSPAITPRFILRQGLPQLRTHATDSGEEVRVRYAPSPTGNLHLGGLRTALFNYLLARKYNGSFILRIEDTDKTREKEGAIQGLLQALHWAQLDHDEGPFLTSETSPDSIIQKGKFGPYIQSQRLDIYKTAIASLVEKGHAYRCFCSSERLSRLRETQARQGMPTLYDRACLGLSNEEVQERVSQGQPHVVRLRIPEGNTKIEDVALGSVNFPHASIDDQVLLKSDGFPTYHLASVVDDHSMQISHVIRGQEWLSSTPKHSILYDAFGWKKPRWVHLPLLVNEDKTKLSKRHGDVAVEQFKEKGYLPEGLLNFVALLGWHPGQHSTQEVFEIGELVNAFSLEGLNHSNCVVDRSKLNWLNTHHVRRELHNSKVKPDMSLSEINASRIEDENDPLVLMFSFLIPEMRRRFKNVNISEIRVPLSLEEQVTIGNNSYSYGYLFAAMLAQHDRVVTIPDFLGLLEPFLLRPTTGQVRTEMEGHSTKNIDTAVARLMQVWDAEREEAWREPDGQQLIGIIKQICKDNNPKLNPGELMQPVRIALTGQKKGSALGRLVHLLGRDECIGRLQTLKELCDAP
eukprot:gb/GECG01016396.1/.p1 GENE.gb/GECG01016396.1/~~gb/GECG01016396.1/.p1  ORF type:complete len:597 (+),score=47.27 gb/GECG01016396.1/:1-1791(+)